MKTESNKLNRTISHNGDSPQSGASAPWWGEIINNVVNTGGDVIGEWINGKSAPTPQVVPVNTGNNNTGNTGGNNNTLLYVSAGAVVVLLLVVLLKK